MERATSLLRATAGAAQKALHWLSYDWSTKLLCRLQNTALFSESLEASPVRQIFLMPYFPSSLTKHATTAAYHFPEGHLCLTATYTPLRLQPCTSF